jgi:hypothetical protein
MSEPESNKSETDPEYYDRIYRLYREMKDSDRDKLGRNLTPMQRELREKDLSKLYFNIKVYLKFRKISLSEDDEVCIALLNEVNNPSRLNNFTR